MIKVNSIDFLNLQDDVIFNNPAIIFYASGCNWKCKYCHSKDTWDFNKGVFVDESIVDNVITDFISNKLPITLIGEGGDFWFQRKEWSEFIKNIKDKYYNYFNLIKVVWYTGAEVGDVEDWFSKNEEYRKYFDVVLCGKPFMNKEELNVKDMYIPKFKKCERVIITKEGRLEFFNTIFSIK